MNRPKNLSSKYMSNMMVVNKLLKDIKKTLPKECTFLSLIKTSPNSEMKISSVVNGTEWRYSLPHDLVMTAADWERVTNLIKEKCYE